MGPKQDFLRQYDFFIIQNYFLPTLIVQLNAIFENLMEPHFLYHNNKKLILGKNGTFRQIRAKRDSFQKRALLSFSTHIVPKPHVKIRKIIGAGQFVMEELTNGQG